MSTPIKPDELQTGDVLLYHGTAFVSKLIRLFDGGDYSHAGVYTGADVAEAVGDGIVARPLPTSVAGAKYVDVYRFISASGKKLNDADYPVRPVSDRIVLYLNQRDRYAYEQILLLAFLASTRRLPVVGWIPGLGRILRTILDSAGEFLSDLISRRREPMICSELVYRVYGEAEADKYKLKIVGADALRAMSVSAFAAAASAQPLPGPEQQDLRELQVAVEDFLAKYAAAKQAGAAPGVITAFAVPDFVTPGDLQRSPNLYKVGTLQA